MPLVLVAAALARVASEPADYHLAKSTLCCSDSCRKDSKLSDVDRTQANRRTELAAAKTPRTMLSSAFHAQAARQGTPLLLSMGSIAAMPNFGVNEDCPRPWEVNWIALTSGLERAQLQQTRL